MYALYKEVHPPTAVEHCVSCRFVRGSSGLEHNLVTAAASYLRVYRLNKVLYHRSVTATIKLQHACMRVVVNQTFAVSRICTHRG